MPRKRIETQTKTCERCKAEFARKRADPARFATQRFCSKVCYEASRTVALPDKHCERCGDLLDKSKYCDRVNYGRARFCSRRCAVRRGIDPNKTKYLRIKVDGRTALVHRQAMENHLGRELTADELVHHKDENKLNNNLENLKVVSPKEHAHEHGMQIHPLTWACEVCGTVFVPPPTKRGGLKRTCSKKCRYVLASRTLRRPDCPNSMYREGAYPSQAKARKG